MKWIHFILATYLLTISLYPCTDADTSLLAQNAMEMNHNHNHDHSSGNQEHDTCPPFCVCNCCGLQIINHIPNFVFNFSSPFQTIPLRESFYVSNLSDTYSGSIWQPPQLV